MAQQQQTTSLDALASLLKLFSGDQKTQTTSGGSSTQTSSKQLDQNTLAGLLQSALESNQGLASVTQGQRTAGLYNSSTNKLLANDLLSRLTVQQAAAGAPTVTTTIGTPQTVKTGSAGIMQGGDMQKLLLGMTAYNKLKNDETIKKGVKGIAGLFGLGDEEETAKGISAAYQSLPGLTNATNATSLGLDATSGAQGISSGGIDLSGMFSSLGESIPDISSYISNVDTGAVAQAAVDTGEAAVNFPQASSTTSVSGGTPGLSNTGNVGEAGAISAGQAAASLGSGVSIGTGGGIGAGVASTPGYSTGDLGSGLSSGSTGAGLNASGGGVSYTGAETSGSSSALSAVSEANKVGNYLGSFGSYTGDIGITDIYKSFGYAQNAPQAEHGKDYRKAVGNLVLSYFGYGWATDIVDAVARPALDASMEAGTESLGYFGAVLADPVGAPISGQFEVDKLVTSTLDPGNIFGGNPGGSIGQMAALPLDPVGAMLGNQGAFGVIADTVNQAEKNDPLSVGAALGINSGGGGLPGLGRVVCTELAIGGEIPVEKYQRVIQPDVTLKGRILLGYHMLGIPAVKKLRSDPEFRKRALPYVNAYLDYKLGKFSWTGFAIKYIGEPLCWVLSFFNKDPEAYKTLYPYRRVRNG